MDAGDWTSAAFITFKAVSVEPMERNDLKREAKKRALSIPQCL